MTADNRQILDALRKKHCMGKAEITIPGDSRRDFKEREGFLRIRYGCFEIKRPKRLDKNKALRGSFEAWVIYAKEENPLKGE